MVVAVVKLVLKVVSWVVVKVFHGKDWEEAWNRSRLFKQVAADAKWRAEEAEEQAMLAPAGSDETPNARWFRNNHVRLMYIITKGHLSENLRGRVIEGDGLARMWFEDVGRKVRRLVNSRNLPDDVAGVCDALSAVDNEDEERVWWAEHIEGKLKALVGDLDHPSDQDLTVKNLDEVLELPEGVPDLPRPVGSWWLELAQVMATWYAAQGQIDDWRDVCQVVQGGAKPEMRRARGWVYEELAAIARLEGDIPAARRDLKAAAGYRGSRGRAQHSHNKALLRLDLRRVEPAGEETAEDALASASRLRYSRDEVGQALTGHAISAVDISSAETLDDNAAAEKMERAAAQLERSAQCFDRESQRRALAAVKTNLVLVHWFNNDSQQARTTGEEALEIYDKLRKHLKRHDRLGRAALLLNLGAVLVQGGGAEVGEGKEYLDNGIALWSELSNKLPHNKNVKQGLGRTYLYLGDAVDTQGGDRSTAEEHWQDAKNWCEKAGDTVGKAEASRRL